MKVADLIKQLEQMPSGAEVRHLWDGEPRTAIELVWLSRDGYVVTSDYGMICYSSSARPADAPTEEEDRYWQTQDAPDDK